MALPMPEVFSMSWESGGSCGGEEGMGGEGERTGGKGREADVERVMGMKREWKEKVGKGEEREREREER